MRFSNFQNDSIRAVEAGMNGEDLPTVIETLRWFRDTVKRIVKSLRKTSKERRK